IPARKNSKGFKNKNRILFNYTANFLKKTKWFNKVIVATDDFFLKKKIENFKFLYFKRNKKNATDDASIKSLMHEVVSSLKLKNTTIIWLFFLTIPHKKSSDFYNFKKITEKKTFRSAISFRQPLTHPYDCWIIGKKLKKYIKNDVYRRQDKIELYEHFHYISAFKVKELNKLNSELINSNTTPIILNNSKNLIEIDSKKDFLSFKKKNVKPKKINRKK
ncbi:hypothetical protein OAQ59_04765, partial [Candidatus Pelagibacter sp.]|nr:hypothetical protein [Candidatus Pelagibacter sp.]